MQLALLCDKHASWPNSRVRDALPDPLRQWLDRQDRQTRNEALQTLKRVDRESGWANAVEAMLSILESTGGADRAGVTLLAARLAEGVAGIECDDDRPDPGEYDIAFTADVGVQGGGRRARRRTKGSTRRPASCSSPRRASTNSPAGPRPARSTPSTACPTRNWRTGNARSTTGSCAAPGSPSSRVSTATTWRTPGSPTATRPGGLLGLGFIPRAQDLVFYGKTGRGKTHLAIGLGMKAIDMGLGVRFHRTAELVPPAGQGQTRRHARDDARGHRSCRLDHTGRVRLRTLRHRRGAPALAGSSRAATKDGASSPPRTSSPVNGARPSRTTNSPPRPATASCTTGGSSSPGPEPPRRRGPHVRQEHLRATGKIRKMHATA